MKDVLDDDADQDYDDDDDDDDVKICRRRDVVVMQLNLAIPFGVWVETQMEIKSTWAQQWGAKSAKMVWKRSGYTYRRDDKKREKGRERKLVFFYLTINVDCDRQPLIEMFTATNGLQLSVRCNYTKYEHDQYTVVPL